MGNFVLRKKHKKLKNVTNVTDISLRIKYTKITKEQIQNKKAHKDNQYFYKRRNYHDR